MKNETILIFDNTNLETQFLRDAGLAFVDPFSVFFKKGKELFVQALIRHGSPP